MKKLMFLSLMLLSQVSLGQSIQLGNASAGGTSCSLASMQISLSEDGSKLSLIPDEFKIADSTRKLERKSCMVAIPVSVPQHQKLVIKAVKIKEAFKLASKTVISSTQNVFLAGQKGVVLNHILGKENEDVDGRVSSNVATQIESGCGQATNIRLNSSLLMNLKRLPQVKDEAKVSEIEISLALEDC
jgi:Domain of unknown function (DUF4360)